MAMTTRLSAVGTLAAKSASAANVGLRSGLTRDQARRRLETFGSNAVPDTAMHPSRMRRASFGRPFRGYSSEVGSPQGAAPTPRDQSPRPAPATPLRVRDRDPRVPEV